MSDPDRAWWKEAVVYQIYPRSFQDSNGDGIGDLQGIVDRLDHVATLADVVWLNPVYQSPQRDNGYDVSDYRAIHEEYGSMADWERLLEEVHDRGLRLVMDLVLNHTSTDHEWFQRSRRGEDNYREYYIWRAGQSGGSRSGADGPAAVPNNWTSAFGGPAWAYDDRAGMYYLHLFDETQADLNWDHPPVREDVAEVVNFWLGAGVDGFRLDVINLVSKPEGLPDGDPDEHWVGMEQFANGPRALAYIEELAARTFEGEDVLTVGECSDVDVGTAGQYVSADGPMDMLFHFEHMGVDAGDRFEPPEYDLTDLKAVISRWQTELAGWNALYLTNHDQPRIVSRFGDEQFRRESATLFGTLLFTLRGTPYVYQGQEIGMTNYPWGDLEEFDDVGTVQNVRAAIEAGEIDGFDGVSGAVSARSRDNARTPMQWDDTEHAGFTDGDPWLPVNPDHTEVNVAAAEADDGSILQYYRRLRSLRADHDALVYGDYDLLCPDHESVWAYRRTLQGADGREELLVVLNVDDTATSVAVPVHAASPAALVCNRDDPSESPPEMELAPYEARVYGL